MKRRLGWGVLTVAAAITIGCAVNPATGKRQFSLIGEAKEIEMGREADAEFSQQLGSYPDEGVNDYVAALGLDLARESERPGLPWSFRVVDDPIVNAFALPGGFIYVTRGILTHLSSEAQLAGVLGHEIGHVTARHSVNRLSQVQLAQLGLGIGSVLSEGVRRFSGLGETGLGLLFLKFGRDQEREADALGLRYMRNANYPPAALENVMAVLAGVPGESGSNLPGWLSTHPDPEDRRQRIRALTEGGQATSADVGRNRFLAKLEGMVFGDNPREGFFQGGRFYHPELSFQLDFPRGWRTFNGKQEVAAQSSGRDAVVTLTLVTQSTPEAAARGFFAQSDVREGRPWLDRVAAGPVVSRRFVASSQQGALVGAATFVGLGGNVYRLLAYGSQAGWSRDEAAARAAVSSFAALTDRRKLNVQPDRVRIVRIDRDMTLAEFDRTHPSAVPLETLALINGVDQTETIEPGTFLKRIQAGRKP